MKQSTNQQIKQSINKVSIRATNQSINHVESQNKIPNEGIGIGMLGSGGHDHTKNIYANILRPTCVRISTLYRQGVNNSLV